MSSGSLPAPKTRRMSSHQLRGTQRERGVANVLRDLGYLVSSRRHLGGAGDLLAIAALWDLSAPYRQPLLIEVKGTTGVPWASSAFGPADRADLLITAELHGCEPMLAWWPPNLGLVWLPAEDWPS